MGKSATSDTQSMDTICRADCPQGSLITATESLHMPIIRSAHDPVNCTDVATISCTLPSSGRTNYRDAPNVGLRAMSARPSAQWWAGGPINSTWCRRQIAIARSLSGGPPPRPPARQGRRRTPPSHPARRWPHTAPPTRRYCDSCAARRRDVYYVARRSVVGSLFSDQAPSFSGRSFSIRVRSPPLKKDCRHPKATASAKRSVCTD